MKDVDRLLEIHEDVTGTDRGRRYGMEVINKSAVLLICASWEAFVEDVATQGIDHIIDHASSHNDVPNSLRRSLAKHLEEHNHELKVWDLADDGWKDALRDHRDVIVTEEISSFNTPKPHNVRQLYKRLFGIEDICENWRWRGLSLERSKRKLREFVELRGAIAHGQQLPQPVTKPQVQNHVTFIVRLAVRTSNSVRNHVRPMVNRYPWRHAGYNGWS